MSNYSTELLRPQPQNDRMRVTQKINQAFLKAIVQPHIDYALLKSYVANPAFDFWATDRPVEQKRGQLGFAIFQSSLFESIMRLLALQTLNLNNIPRWVELLNFCKSHHLDINRKDEDGKTEIFHWVSTQSNSVEALEVLIQAGADISIVDNQGHDVITHAFVFRSFDAAVYLLQRKAPFLTDKEIENYSDMVARLDNSLNPKEGQMNNLCKEIFFHDHLEFAKVLNSLKERKMLDKNVAVNAFGDSFISHSHTVRKI